VQFAVAAVALLVVVTVTVATVALLEVAACVAKNAGSMPACEQKNGAAPKTGGRACAGRYLQPHTTTPESDGHACTRVLSFKDLDACNLTPPPSPMGMRVRVCYPSSGSSPMGMCVRVCAGLSSTGDPAEPRGRSEFPFRASRCDVPKHNCHPRLGA